MIDAATKTGRRATAAWTAVLALFVVPAVAVAIESALHFSGSAIDGPFQLYNALRRIEAGFQPGVDFQFFHGVGVPYLHYWLFRLFGGQFVDSELARQLVSAIVFPASSLIFFRAFAGNWTRALALTTAMVALVILLRFPALLYAINSMIGVRSALPILLPVVLYLAPGRRARVMGGGITLGLALFVSTEQGLASLAAFVVVSTLVALRSSARREEIVASAATLGLGVGVLFLALVLVGGFAGAAGALRYNYQIVPMDQYWFFGAPPNPFISSWGAGLRMAAQVPNIGLALLFAFGAVGLYLTRLWKAGSQPTDRDRAFALLAVYGLLSCASLLGVFVPVYALPCWRVLISLGLLELIAWGDRQDAVQQRPLLLGLPKAAALVGLSICAATIALRRSVVSAWVTSVPHVLASHIVHHSRFEARGIWPQTLAIDSQVVSAHRTADGKPPVIWSTYSGWLEARAGVFNPSFDYLIHALGPANRRDYLDLFQRTKPALVQTVSPRYTPYEAWIENANWDLYRELLTSYAVTAETPWSLLWEPRVDVDTARLALGSIDVPPGAASVRLPVAPPLPPWPVTLLEVEIEYQTANPLQRLPVVGPSPRYLVEIGGAVSKVPVSLDPFTTSARFPIMVAPGQETTLGFQVFSLLPGVRLTVSRVRVWALPVHPRNEIWLRSLAERLSQ